jgi:hypothetical protein
VICNTVGGVNRKRFKLPVVQSGSTLRVGRLVVYFLAKFLSFLCVVTCNFIYEIYLNVSD